VIDNIMNIMDAFDLWVRRKGLTPHIPNEGVGKELAPHIPNESVGKGLTPHMAVLYWIHYGHYVLNKSGRDISVAK
jgi:hypothetical protein